MNLINIPTKVINFLKEVKAEIKKVNWPTKKETAQYTLIIIFVSILIAIFLGGLDFLFTALLNRFIF